MLVLLKLVLFKSQYYFEKLVLIFIVSIKKHFGAPYSVVVHTFFDYTGNTVDETGATFEPIQQRLFTKRIS